ncbi:MAG: UDP-N-acetylglucosamine 1-carboxyvinyltransferase [Verrucomicrobia bacterium]|nr:MAG: UDP-N-acetylglucosamine 1-carboxyvinyltransferase [Verrucomicrobiota bacterium]
MARFIIHGQRPLNGAVEIVGNKNAALPMLAACLLTDETVTLHRVPQILDVAVMLDLIASLGVSVERTGGTVRLCAARLRRRKLDPELCRRVRSSILLAGPLAARHGRAELPPPGGDVIGRRRVDTHLNGLRELGIQTEYGRSYVFRRRQLRGAKILLDEASVTGTENLMMAAALAPGMTTLHNAACEPHVQDLGELLCKMGARITGLGTNRLCLEGVEQLHGAEHTVGPDYIELGSYVAAAAATGGTVTATGAFDPLALGVIAKAFRKLGVNWNVSADGLQLTPRKGLRVRKDFGGEIPKIEDGAWPAFPSDLMSVALVLATQATGSVLFFEKMFESRMYFVDRLLEMGAHIVQCDPHRVVVAGPARLHGTHQTSPDIRAGMALIIAALCAKGASVIENAQMVDRGYERLDARLRALGADVIREES